MFYSAGYSSGYADTKAAIQTEHYAHNTPQQIERECSSREEREVRKCIAEILQTERENERGESDLAAQWRAADWVMIAGVIASAQLLATIVGLYYIKGTLDQTVRAVQETANATRVMVQQNDIAIAQARPYLVVVNHFVRWSYDYLPNYQITFGIDIENVGATIATDFRIDGQISIELDDAPMYQVPMRTHLKSSTIEPRKPENVMLSAHIDLPEEILDRLKGNAIQVILTGVYSFTGAIIEREFHEFTCKAGGRPIGINPADMGGGLAAAAFEIRSRS